MASIGNAACRLCRGRPRVGLRIVGTTFGRADASRVRRTGKIQAKLSARLVKRGYHNLVIFEYGATIRSRRGRKSTSTATPSSTPSTTPSPYLSWFT